ncbi:virion structural protein [Synechococcus phage S-CAM22]|uniref:Baseplate wedge protein n=1 Tax=Synechococcus phage S-CAM22 TaxID=1883365 RepID=A0A1D8KQE4_9CAUD|nr:virion structural protein [Synechococcus phage S-CAM22]AOV60911.1 baseplate wedge protein [Synechococcus phage S-CAM22]
MNINKVSQSIDSQSPEFLKTEYPLFNKFLEYYYRSQEKTGLGQNIVNNFLQYLDIDKLDIGILGGTTKVVENITTESDEIVVESIDNFLDRNGSILIGDEVIYYESTTSSPNISLNPGISYDQVKLKWTGLAQIINSFNGTTRRFSLTSQSSPVSPPSAQHLIVSLYGEILIPNVDYTVEEDNIVFTVAPRTRLLSDDNSQTYITFLNGFIENVIVPIDDMSPDFGDSRTQFSITRNGVKYEPVADEYILAVYDNQLLVPKEDFFIDGDIFIFNDAPLNGRILSLYSIEAPIPSFGSGAVGYARINDSGQLSSIEINQTGSGYEYKYPPRVSISSANGSGAAALALVNGVKNSILLDGGKGYSDTNPPTVVIQSPTSASSVDAKLKAVVTNGTVTSIQITNSGSGYTFIPRVSFKQPGGAKLGTVTLTNGSVTGSISVLDGGEGYTTPPEVYIDEPLGDNPVKAKLSAVLTDGKVTSININSGGQGYLTTPRIAIIDPASAQVLETVVDSNGRITAIELLNGGLGYDDVPSVYIVDNREDGGTGAAATASVFNGKITDINITNFGSGYSQSNPPTVIIQDPPEARCSVEIGLNEITGFSVLKEGSGFNKSKFVGCARAASGIIKYTETGNAIFSNNTTASEASVNTEVKCLDALFVKRLLDKYTEQFLPDVPELDYTKIDVRNAIKSVKDFYSTKGTSFSIAYLFKLLYGEQVTVSYPKDQIIKPSNATWSIDTILRATLVSGDPTNIKDGLLTQDADIADPNIKFASALIENYISIKTSDIELFELVLSEETIEGTFVVPYKTKLAEPLNTTDSIITVDSTIGWPERNGEFLIGNAELIQYKEKSLNQFIECTRSVNNIVEDWDSATEVTSNLVVYVNKGTAQEVVLNIVGIVDAQQTTLTDTGSYYLAGDKLTVSKLGGTSTKPELTTWLYNVKKLLEVESITFGGVNNQFATVTCANNHGLLVGDQVTVYGANPILFNGTFLVTSRDNPTVFQYQLPQPAEVTPQGNILVSVDLNKGKSDNVAVLNSIGPYTTNIQNAFFNDNYVYVASTGIPNYNIGPFPGSALLPGNQRKLNRFPLVPQTISVKNTINPGSIGTWINGTSVWSYKSEVTKTFGPVTSIDITSPGSDYDASSPPNIVISGGGGSGATGTVTVNGSITEIIVTNSGTGYTSSPLVSIVGGGGSGAAATAIVTKGVVSSILMNTNGTGYTSQPTITIVGGGGTGAAATASVRGPVKSVAVTNGGESYTSDPTVSLSSGSGAVAQPIVSNGRIISIAIISAGSGYTTAPEVTIQGDGFGAVARASIDTDGENAGRVTSIEIINRGINYIQGTTVINLTSVGSGATFVPNVFEWTYNLQETTTVDSAKGSVFAGYNNQYGGEYAHISNPQRLRYILGDNLFEQVGTGNILEQEDQLTHSPIIGWAFDGNPIYGPYGYSDPTDQSSPINKLNTSYKLKTNLVVDQQTNPVPVRIAGPLLSEEPAGKFIEDYEYSFGLGDLDQYNGRFCKTPDFPEGRYCYFITIDNSEAGIPQFPYVLGPSFNSIVDFWNLDKDAIQQNIPTGVVRYRDPYENVDIDVDRSPNVSTNALTMENGDILLFDVEDENKDGVISQDEIDDPDQLFEESPLQLFDYFPKVKFDSRVDIEVETTTKFEDASVTGFTIEDPGSSYQVNDILVFDNSNTDGGGVSARISKIKGETVSSYGFETIEDEFYGVLTTSSPHNLIVNDTVFVDYTPIMDATNKTFTVRQLKGIEEITIDQPGSGYDVEIPPTIIIDGDGEYGELRANVTSTGSINVVDIVNSGSGYTKNPRVILSHPQVFKRADYYVALVQHENYVKINDVVANDLKEIFFCGKTVDASNNEVAFVSKFSALGVKEWEKTIESTAGETYTEFLKLDVSGNDIWVVGQNKPNSAILTAYNPDIILAKYTQATDGLSASLSFQKGYAGISGSTRSDNISAVKKYSDTRYIIGGFTNTNSANPQDAFIASIDSTGSFAAKRKIASASGSEKITDLIVLNDAVYFIMETAASGGAADSKISFGKALIGTSVITIEWIKEINNSTYSFRDTSLVVDEFDEFYITATLALKSNNSSKDNFWVGKIDASGDLIWNYRYAVDSGNSIELASRSTIDIFGDLNLAFTKTNTSTNFKTVDTVKISYDGKLKKHTNTEFNKNNIEGITVHAITVDNSGDPYVFGQTQWNRNEFLCEFASDATDKTGHYTLSTLSATGSDSVKYEGGYAKILGKDATAGRLLTIDTVSGADSSRTAGTYTIGASDYSTDASGTGATFSVVVAAGGAATVTVVNPGSGFAVNETFTITDANLGGGGGASLTFDAATVSSVGDWVNGAIKVPGASLGTKLSGDWTLEYMLYKDGSNYRSNSQTQYTLLNIGDATDATGGLWLYYNHSNGKLELVVTNNTTTINSASSPFQSVATTMFADNSWQFIGVKKEGNVFTVYVNGISVINGTIANTSLSNKDLHIGNIPGKSATTGQFRSNEQLEGYVDNLRLRNRPVTPTVPSDADALPPTDTFALAYDWTDDAWFTTNLKRYDYIDYVGWGLKSDKESDTERLGDKGLQTNTQIGFARSAITPVTGSVLTVTNTAFTLGSEGLQGLDFEDATITMTENTESLSYSNDEWSSRTATVPSPGSKKLKISANINNRYYIKTTNTIKIDNVQELTINQKFNVTVGSKLVLNNTSGAFINSGYVLRVDNTNNKVYVAVNNNAWSNDLTTGRLSTAQFSESSSYGIVGSVPNDINVITDYVFANKINTTPGTFNFDLQDYNLDRTAASTGQGNLDEFATFKPFNIEDYKVQILEISGSSSFIPGSVVDITSSDISFNTAKSTAQITNLTGVTKISLISTLDKILQVTAVSNTDEVYVITSDRHYFSAGDNIFVDGNPTQQVSGTAYDEYDGSFVVDRVVSNKEFTYKLNAVAQTDPSTIPGNVSIFGKSPVLKMYYGHQYLFDVSHSSMLGTNLSFSKDNLYKLEYSFNSIERVGTPGVTGIGQPNPTIKLKVDNDIVTNISYYFDPSRTGSDSPIDPNSYLDIVDSPYLGTFTISEVAGATITTGANTMKFKLANEPEGIANITTTSYSTSSEKAVGAIGDIRLINSGGFYSKLPVISGIQSSRKIERVQIEEPGTEYAVGVYNSVPISGDGEGGFVSIVVADGTDDEGATIPGQIQSVTITSPGKGYTTASIDIESIEGILGPGLTGSGADISVIIPEFGTGAVVFAKGTNVGKIKKLKNNNFGYDYTHDYTLRPEITFPINAQLTSTSILDSITVTDPGSGYSQAPAVIITGGGGSGAIAEASIRNGRIDNIIIKDPGAGYSSSPTVELRSSFNYVVNLDLGLLQFAFPHGITNGSEVTLNVVDTGEGAEFPLSSGATGRLNGTTTYYAITGTANSLEPDQMKLAITPANAELGDGLSFVNAGTGRQQVLTASFGATATANVITSTFLEGELVYQGGSLDTATATGYVSTNQGWQIGPRILKIVNYDNTFTKGESVTGVISKSSGIISDLNIAKGVLEIGPITKTTGQFIDDVGKPSEIIQKIQDSYYYQDFSYAVKSSVSIDDWKDILIKNVHPASFKVFGELNLEEYGYTANKEIDFELTKSVELSREAIVPNIQNFALAEPVYSEFNNTEVLFRQKRLTSSENILTSVVQRLDNISNLFDGERTQFPLTVNNGDNIIASADQLLIVLNGVAQTPNTSFEVQGDSIVFVEPPQPPASVKYVNVTISPISTKELDFTFTSGIFPSIGNTLVGVVSTARLTVTKVAGSVISGFVTEGTFIGGEQCQVGATGFSGTLATISNVVSNGLFLFNEQVTNLTGDTGKVETSNLQTGQETPLGKLRYGIGAATTNVELVATAGGAIPAGTFTLNDDYQIGSEIVTVTQVTNGANSTTVTLTRGVSGTTAVSQQENTPIYSTEISVTNTLTLSKTTGTYQSTPGLYDIQLDDYIIGAKSGVVARITSTSAYQDPVTNEFIEQVNISEGSSFFGLLFNRLASISYPNKVLDDISKSQVSIVDFTDNISAFDSQFPSGEPISNNILVYDNDSGNLVDNEYIRNYKIDYGSEYNGTFGNADQINIRKLTFDNSVGNGFFARGQVIRTTDTKAEVVGYSQPTQTIYLGKIGRSKSTGEDYHSVTFTNATINTYNEKYGTGCLALSPGTSVHTFVSGVTNAITASNGATGSFTAAAGTTYNPFTGDMVIEIGTHSLTTSNKVTIADGGVVFTCAQDGNTGNKAYPRATDPASGSALTITAETNTTITVNVGAVPVDEYASIATSTEFGFGTGAYTIECWIKPNSIASGSKAIFDMRTAGTEVSAYLYLDGANLKYYVNGSVVITGATNLVANTWYHVAVSRTSTTTKMFLDGTQEGSNFSDSGNYGSTKPVRIGAAFDASADFPGYIDEFRISNSGRYTTNFTAPTGMFQGDANTKLLLHFDGAYGQTYTEDWSGGESLTDGEEFNNDAILATYNTNNQTAPVTGFAGKTHRYYDAANLIVANKDFIAKEAVYLLTQQYSSLVIPGGNVNCEDDVRDILDAIAEDMRNGSNNHIWDASALYVDRTANPITISHVDTEVTETVWAYDKVKEILQYIINNVLWTVQGNHGLTQFTDSTLTDSNNNSYTTFTPTGATYDAATGDLVLTIGTNSLTTSSLVALERDSITFTCADDNNDREIAYPDKGNTTAYDKVLAVKARTSTTITVNVGASPIGQRYVHTFVSATANAVKVLNYTTGDCADVYSTISNLLDILTDTLEQANAQTPVDHLATITKVEPAREYQGGTVDAFNTVEFDLTYHNSTDDIVYTHRIDGSARDRFRDAANLIRANNSVVVDKAAHDMLTRYPDLVTDMPRNVGGGIAGTLRCKTDLGLIVEAIAKDIEYGGNKNTVRAAKFYVDSKNELKYIRLQVWQSVYAHDRLGVYLKEAVTGDLTYDNTDNIITGDWGITNDAGGCANVKSAIDTLITTINDIIAPTNNDFNIGGDRLYFNRDYITQEISGKSGFIGLLGTDLQYTINNGTFSALTYTINNYRHYIEDFIIAAISDLQTGGNNSVIGQMETFLSANKTITEVDEELYAFFVAHELIKTLGEKAIKNLLYSKGASVTGDQYAASHTDISAYRDSESPSDIDEVWYRFRDLVDFGLATLFPGDVEAKSAVRNILFNKNYYKQEIASLVNNQFGSSAWIYDSFIDQTVNNIQYDYLTSNTLDVQTAYTLTFSAFNGQFVVGETVTSGGTTAKVLYTFESEMVIGTLSGSIFAAGANLTAPSGATATIATGGVTAAHEWYNNYSNVETIKSARSITSLIGDSVNNTNLWTLPEQFNQNWAATLSSVTANNALSPDNTQTAEKVDATATTGEHFITRSYTLTSFDTFDSSSVKFDSTSETFDTGAAQSTQTFTSSMFVKKGEYDQIRFTLSLGDGTENAQFSANLTNGTTGSLFSTNGIDVTSSGMIPIGGGWFRIYMTVTFGFGFDALNTRLSILASNGALDHLGLASNGVYVWGAKLTNQQLGSYRSVLGTTFYTSTEYNIKTYAIDRLKDYMSGALSDTLVSPSPTASFAKFYDSSAGNNYDANTAMTLVRSSLNTIRSQLADSEYYTNITENNAIPAVTQTITTTSGYSSSTSSGAISTLTKVYGDRDIPVGISGEVVQSDYAYSLTNDVSAEIQQLTLNEAKLAKVYKRFRIDGSITDGPFSMNENVSKQGDSSITGVVYGFHEDANYKYLDVAVTAGTWQVTDVIVGATNSTTAQVSAIENRLHLIDVAGSFVENVPFKGYTSTETAEPVSYTTNSAAVLDNTGGRLTVDTASLLGSLETTSVVYPSSSREYLEVKKYDGLDVQVGDKIASTGHVRLTVSVDSTLTSFTVGNRIYRIVNGGQDTSNYGIITEYDSNNNYIYYIPVVGTISSSDTIGDYSSTTSDLVGRATVSGKTTVSGTGSARIQEVRDFSLNKRLYLTEIAGSFTARDGLRGPDNYRSAVIDRKELKARTKRFFKGFDGTQTIFNLTTDNGSQYLPDPEGHMMIFVNGILQPPGATNAFTAFSDKIQFSEPPELGASFTGFYLGKLRQLDDISFEFDSLRQSFNLKRDDVFYSLTLTDGVQSSTIRPENNIIISVNGVLQEPGVGFEIVGSRIIFSEIPRFGSTFVGFSYVGSEADVDADTVVPPVEAGDFIDIEGEVSDREVAVIESSNSLITFDYLGSVFGQNANATANLTSGFIERVSVTSGGSGYTSRPVVRLDSISGFDGQVKALVGVAGVTVTNAGSGYSNPDVDVATTVPDNWTAPNLADYGEELVDPEV